MLALLVPLLLVAQPVVVLPHGTASIGANGSGTCGGSVTADACRLATVTASQLESVPITLKVSTPSSTSIGTVVFLAGGGWTSFVELGGASAVTMVQELSKTDNFTVIQTACGFPTGASTPGCNVNMRGTGLKLAGGRLPTLIDAIDADAALHRAGTPICVVAQSGGGVFAGMGLLHYDMESNVDLVITTGGPAVTREDYHCESRTNAAWSAICDARQLSGGGGGCTGIPDFVDNAFGWNGARGDCAQGSNRAIVPWRQDSMISAGADYVLSTTKWIFLFGAQDLQDIVVPMARLVQDQLAAYNGGSTCASGNNSVCLEQTASGTTHTVYSTTTGAELIRLDLLTYCFLR